MANPTEAYPSSATIAALNGTTDAGTGLEYIGRGTAVGSSPSLQERIDRRWAREIEIYGPLALRVVKVDDTHIGCFAGKYRLAGVDYSYAGEASVTANPSGDDTYYVYLTSSGSIDVVTDATDWPVDVTTYIPLAEVTVAAGVITAIVDVRGRVVLSTPQAASIGSGTSDTAWTLDSDNGGAAADCELRANRGSTGNDAALRFDGATGDASLLSDRDGDVTGNLTVKSVTCDVTTGTAPLTVDSTTKVDNLNVDAVDGVNVVGGGSLDPGGVPYVSDVDELTTIAAGDAGDVLISGGAGAPEWSTPNTDEVVQAWDADLEALAGVSSAGMLARTGAGTAAARTITGGVAVGVTNGDGVSGNPTIDVAGMTEHAVPVGTSGGSLATISAGASNTVLAGNTGDDPVFRQIVNADISNSAAIESGKVSVLADGLAATAPAVLTTRSGALSWSKEAPEYDAPSGKSLTAADAGFLFTNTPGSGGYTTFTLPVAASTYAGLVFKFAVGVGSPSGVKLQASGSDVITFGGDASSAGGYAQSTAFASAAHVMCIATGASSYGWVGVSFVGTWTLA